MVRNFLLLSFSCWLVAGVVTTSTAQDDTAEDDRVLFNRDVRPILSNNCFHCHGPDVNHQEADLRLDEAEHAYEDRGGYFAIKPGSLDESDVWQRIISDDEDLVMPPPDSHKELTADEKVILSKWIEQGAEYQGHWAFIAPTQAALPNVDNARFAHQPIDRFIAARLQSAGLAPNERAQKEVLIRRVTLDLTGLPPTLDEVEAFLADESPEAYERVVDRLLKSPQFGERMGVVWLDAARYGDTSVFHADGPRDMWVWRDWVVEAFNNNLPYDQFTIQQIAGDLLPEPTWRELVATGFNRNNATTDEGGAIAEEFRVEYAVDRVKTTSMVWLGLTMECAQCHEHKYDPITQEDYYRFFAFFNQAADPGMQTRGGNQKPIVEVPDLEDQKQVPVAEAELKAVEERLVALEESTRPEFEAWLNDAAELANLQEPPAGDVVRLAFNQADKKQLADSRSPESPGQLEGNSKLEAGKLGQAIRTNPKGWAKFPVGDFERDQAFSYSVWFKSNKAASGSPLARMDVGGGHRGYDLLVGADKLEFHLIHQWPENALKVIGKAKIEPGKWHHVCVTYDGSSKADGVRIYHNGKPVEQSASHDSLTDSVRTTTPFLIGRRSQGAEFDGWVDEVRLFERVLSQEEVERLRDWDGISDLLRVAAGERTDEQNEQLKQHYLREVNADYQASLKELDSAKKRLADLKLPLSTVMVMRNVEKPRMTYVLDRGQYDSPNEDRPVEPGTPRFLPQLAEGVPQDRLALAQWMVSDENPLTSRVAVNRFWQLLFGNGIVNTLEEFGSQGEWPSHPELLDYLAVDFRTNGWDVKRLLKQMVMSETYCQSSLTTPEKRERDPDNRLLARGPRFRLSAEIVRDQALAVSGLLVDKIGGPSVKPYQPPGLWSEVSLNPGVRFVQDKGEKLYRRSLYTYWKRSSPPPMMLIFDAPSREKCSIARSNTNTPLQALVLMNDPQFLEAARAMAQRVLLEADLDDRQRIERAYRWVAARQPSERVMAVLEAQLDRHRDQFSKSPDQAGKLLAHGESQRDESIDPAEHAAWMIICSILLNMDETVTRG